MFNEADFLVFDDQILEGRLGKIRQLIDPKFEKMIDELEPIFNRQNLTVYAHVAKHARRTVNPPVDTWIAFGPNKRGYKKDPHIELGFWDDRMFLSVCLLAESKGNFSNASKLMKLRDLMIDLGEPYKVSQNHMEKGLVDLQRVPDYIETYAKVKSAEFIIGREWMRHDKFFESASQLQEIRDSIQKLLPIYQGLIE